MRVNVLNFVKMNFFVTKFMICRKKYKNLFRKLLSIMFLKFWVRKTHNKNLPVDCFFLLAKLIFFCLGFSKDLNLFFRCRKSFFLKFWILCLHTFLTSKLLSNTFSNIKESFLRISDQNNHIGSLQVKKP